ncbi:MAG: EF-hand domain-containing protein [Desulfovibrionales bacterium]
MKKYLILFLLIGLLIPAQAWSFLGFGDDDVPEGREKIQEADFEELDLDGDQNVSPAEFRAFFESDTAAFTEFDVDRDDLISRTEFENVKAVLGKSIPDLSFEEADLDGDNNINITEFNRVYAGNQVQEVFTQFDADNDDAIDSVEFDKLIMQLEEGALTDEQLQQQE